MKVKVTYDADGTKIFKLKRKRLSSQIVPGTTTAIVMVLNENGEPIETYHFSKVYMIERVSENRKPRTRKR